MPEDEIKITWFDHYIELPVATPTTARFLIDIFTAEVVAIEFSSQPQFKGRHLAIVRDRKLRRYTSWHPELRPSEEDLGGWADTIIDGIVASLTARERGKAITVQVWMHTETTEQPGKLCREYQVPASSLPHLTGENPRRTRRTDD